MGIKFECVHCGHTLHVKDFLAGKRGICPHCQGKIDIPNSPGSSSQAEEGATIAVEIRAATDEQPIREKDVPTVASQALNAQIPTSPTAGVAAAADATIVDRPAAAAGAFPADLIAEAPQLHWYVLPPGSITKYGPAQGEMMRTWISEGRVAADALVWREGWSQWRMASSAFPHLAFGATQVPEKGPAPRSQPTAPATSGNSAATVAVVLAVDEPLSLPGVDKSVVRRPAARRARDQRNLAVKLLAALVVVLLPVLIYVLLHQ